MLLENSNDGFGLIAASLPASIFMNFDCNTSCHFGLMHWHAPECSFTESAVLLVLKSDEGIFFWPSAVV